MQRLFVVRSIHFLLSPAYFTLHYSYGQLRETNKSGCPLN